MGIDSRRPPLPAPTESMDENDTSGGDTEVATNVTSRTDKTHYTIPEDGRPITISTQKVTAGGKGGSIGKHGRQKSQTSLLIEYFEASKTGDKSRSRPSVRVKVTPSSAKKGRSGGDSVQITSIGGDRKPSYTRRIPLPSGKQSEGTELSASSDSNVSAHPPVEIEVLNNSDISRPDRSSRGLMYAPVESNVSSMPPDSMLEGENSVLESDLSYDDTTAVKETAYLRAPQRTGSQSRTNSRDRIAQRVMEKLGATATTPRKSSRSSSRDFEAEGYTRDRRRSSKSQRSEDDAVTGAESSLLSNRSDRSYRSGHSQARSMTNNPKLLEMVEDTIKRMILPEINQMKEDQKIDRKLHKYDDSRSGSMGASSTSLERKVSKSSSTPHLVSRPKVVLNRDGDDPGVVLSRGDSERVKHRRSSREHSDRPSTSRRSSGRHSREGSYESEEKLRKKSSRSTNGLRGAAAAGLAAGVAGGALTSAALRHHDSQGDLSERRKRRSKSKSSRSRSASINDSVDETYTKKEKVPAMPLASAINDSDITRDSLLSSNNDHPSSRDSAEIRTPIREVSRGSLGDGTSPNSSRTPTRPVSRQDKNLGMSHTNLHLQNSPLNSPARESPASVKSPNGGISNKTRLAALAAAGLGGAAAAKSIDSRHVDADGYGDSAPRRQLSSGSPVQSVSSLRRTFEDSPLIPQGLRPRSAASHSSVDRLRESQKSPSSLRSDSAPTTQRLAQSAKHSRDVSVEGRETPIDGSDAAFWREGTGTPGAETADEWLERQHLINDQYRDSLATNRDSYQTNPYPEDAKRFTMYTDDSYLDETGEHDEQGLRDIDGGGLAPNYVHTPVAVESAVASLMEPSTISSHVISATSSARKSNGGSYSDRMAAQLKEMGQDKSPIYNGSTMSENIPSQDRWAAIKGHARNLSGQSPAQSPVREQRIDEKPVMTASGLPLAGDPMPEIGHYDSQSDLQTNPSIIQGPLGGDATGKSTWPYTPEPESNRNSTEQKVGLSKGAMLAGATAGGAAAIAAAHAGRQPKVEDDRSFEIDREATPTGRSFRDEGYATDGRTRSGGGITPKAELYGKQDLEEYHRAMDAQDLGDDDPFSPASADPRHMRQVSGNSHGMDSPLYDASTGKGLDRIESKDIVALMDHLTVRDAQRNARDTEILVTLVRSAAEMRSSFDEMKKFIAEQDKLIMQNTDRDAELTAQKVLGGPRPQPVPSPRTPRRQVNSEEDIQQKRKGVLSRALKGLTGGKSAKDLARVEEMLMQILDNVEDLKYQQNQGAPLNGSFTADSMDTYENMRATQDSGYEPEGQAGTSSTPSQSGHFPITPREKQQFHSGYDGRRGSDNRVSTVLEESDDELEPHEAHVLNHQFENNERLLTPTQERQRTLGLSPRNTPPQPNVAANNDQTPEKQRKHKSNSSSLFGMSVPKISRWSRTTTSSAAPEPATLDSPKQTLEPKKSFDSSRSSLDDYDDDGSSFRSKDTLPRKQNAGQYAETRSMRSQASSRLTRTPSPLIPSEASAKQHASQGYDPADSPVQEDDEAQFDDPKYQAHRNSLLLQHPQPRQGTTSRHQNTLESQAHSFDDPAGTNSDLSQRTVSDFDPSAWGSSGTAGLARHRLTQVEPLSPVSLNHQEKYGNRKDGSDSDPLVPQQKPAVPPKIKYDDPEEWEEPQYSNSGFSKGGYYTSPYGSGHLLEPIEEVRYSLETDSGRNMSPDPQVASAKAVNINSPARKGLTGPRPMGSSRTPSNSNTVKPAAADHTPTFSGTVRRKPVPGAQGTNSVESLYSRFAM